MKETSVLLAFFAIFSGSSLLAQDIRVPEIPAGAVVRQVNCTITSDRTDFDDIVARARELERGENSPNRVQFRRLIIGTDEYTADFQIGQYYPSVSEMVRRRVAAGNEPYGRLGVECGSPSIVRNQVAHNGGQLSDDSLMTYSFCNINQGWNPAGVFNVLQKGAANAQRDTGNDTNIQVWTPLMGGPINRDWDFILVQVGADYEGLTERQDIFREGYRPVPASGGGRTCSRLGLWRTVTIFANN